MASLRAVEDRDAKGNTTRLNPSITYKQDRQIRQIVGRHDWRLVDNPDYHPPITVQVQNGEARFFNGVPDTSQTRALAKEISIKDVPQYIVKELQARPIKVREPRPTVYEVRVATIGDVETAVVTEIPNDGVSVTITPTAPDVAPRLMGGAPA